jgi:hypothetical protein
MLDLVSKEVAEISVIEQKPGMEGRRMVMVLGPRAGVIRPTPLLRPPVPPPAGSPPDPSVPKP